MIAPANDAAELQALYRRLGVGNEPRLSSFIQGSTSHDNRGHALTFEHADQAPQTARGSIIDDMAEGDVSRAELDAKLETIEARMDARVARIEGKFDALFARMDATDKRVEETNNRLAETNHRLANLHWWVIGAALTTVLGVAAFNATVLGNMVASFDSGKATAAAISDAAARLEKVQAQVAAQLPAPTASKP